MTVMTPGVDVDANLVTKIDLTTGETSEGRTIVILTLSGQVAEETIKVATVALDPDLAASLLRPWATSSMKFGLGRPGSACA
jgi:hypothetical protein